MTVLGRPVRRIICADINGVSVSLADETVTDIRYDPARPGFESSEVWVDDGSDAFGKGITLTKRHRAIEPPPGGSICRIVTFPPDAVWSGKVGAAEVQSYFASTGSPHASTYAEDAPHPYMQKTLTLDFCMILKGEITLVLDTAEVVLKAGDTVVQKGTNHAWSNRTDKPCTIVFAVVDGADVP